MIKLILNLLATKAPKSQWYLMFGAYFLRKGCNYKIGDRIVYDDFKKPKTYYIANLHYDFAKNKINHTLTLNKPIEKK